MGSKEEEIPSSFQGYVEHAYRQNGIVFACMLVRMMIFSEARFQFRRLSKGRPGELFGTEALSLLEKPWAGAVTSDLLARTIQDADLAGSFFATTRGKGENKRIVRLRPDWVTLILGSYLDPRDDQVGAWHLDAEVLGYMYQAGGKGSGNDPVFLERENVVHFAPIPDPLASFRGMSWLTPIVREIMGDKAATTHKLSYLENGASPNLVVSFDKDMDPDELKKWLEAFKANHEGAANAFKTLVLAAGASADVVGSNMREIDFKKVQAAGENRIAVASGMSGIIVGLSEGMEAATLANYGQARRRDSDVTLRYLWRKMAGAFATVVDTPTAAELWFDDRDIAFLQEDLKDEAEIQHKEAITIRQYVDAGFTPESAVAAVESGDLSRLVHTGLFSVQLQPPGTQIVGANGANGSGDPAAVPAPSSGA
ncbi:MAG TPA: phage portal protein [Solirubrobacterales bacterium]|nr:phage portal protein [Solirubrobacterales bacterium]